jgi:ABC-2 type transport system ATP-binding protein
MISALAIEVSRVFHHYGRRRALDDLSLAIEPGEIFSFLGPNGGGKTTLFRLLSTLIPIQEGNIRILGYDVRRESRVVRAAIGVVFQAPSLDKKLSVAENVRHQGRLYGMHGRLLAQRQAEMLARLGLADRANELCESLSGGLRRRVELAKGMLHRPRLLLLDEPSTGLDPGARSDLWSYLRELRDEHGVTIVLTTHLLEEADKADRIAILHQGSLVALDTPDALRATVGGDSITIQTAEPARLAAAIRERFGCETAVLDEHVRLEQPDGHLWVARLVEAFPGQIDSVTLGKPTLEDVFIDRTGHRFWQQAAGGAV